MKNIFKDMSYQEIDDVAGLVTITIMSAIPFIWSGIVILLSTEVTPGPVIIFWISAVPLIVCLGIILHRVVREFLLYLKRKAWNR